MKPEERLAKIEGQLDALVLIFSGLAATTDKTMLAKIIALLRNQIDMQPNETGQHGYIEGMKKVIADLESALKAASDAEKIRSVSSALKQ